MSDPVPYSDTSRWINVPAWEIDPYSGRKDESITDEYIRNDFLETISTRPEPPSYDPFQDNLIP